jgi:hypothetical protein
MKHGGGYRRLARLGAQTGRDMQSRLGVPFVVGAVSHA